MYSVFSTEPYPGAGLRRSRAFVAQPSAVDKRHKDNENIVGSHENQRMSTTTVGWSAKMSVEISQGKKRSMDIYATTTSGIVRSKDMLEGTTPGTRCIGRPRTSRREHYIIILTTAEAMKTVQESE